MESSLLSSTARGRRQPVPSVALWATVLVLGLLGLGCGETVQFNVIRAAKINVKALAGEKDATVSVGKWTAADPKWSNAAQEIAQHLREAVTNAPGGVVKFADAGGVVTLDGNVMEHGFSETERQEKRSRQETRNNQKVTIGYTHYTRSGKATVRVAMHVIDGTGKTLAAETVPLSEDAETTADVDDGDNQTTRAAPAIDWEARLAHMRADAASKLAKAIVPYPVVVSKPWFSCGDANESCKAGLVQLRSGNFNGALEQFKAAEAKLTASPKPDPKAQSAVYWAMTLTHEFGGDYDKAKVALDQAIRLNPGEETYSAEHRSIQAEATNSKRLSAQGVSAGP